MDPATNVIFGLAGGLVYSLTGYAKAHKEGEAFNLNLFVTTSAVPMAAGVIAGLVEPDPLAALTAGLVGRHVLDVISAYIPAKT